MKEFFSVVFRNSLARDYAIASAVICVLGVFAVQAITNLVESTRQNVRIQQANLTPSKEDVRNYQISRSVLDDTVVTGSISRASTRPVILDPCNGTVKNP